LKSIRGTLGSYPKILAAATRLGRIATRQKKRERKKAMRSLTYNGVLTLCTPDSHQLGPKYKISRNPEKNRTHKSEHTSSASLRPLLCYASVAQIEHSSAFVAASLVRFASCFSRTDFPNTDFVYPGLNGLQISLTIAEHDCKTEW